MDTHIHEKDPAPVSCCSKSVTQHSFWSHDITKLNVYRLFGIGNTLLPLILRKNRRQVIVSAGILFDTRVYIRCSWPLIAVYSRLGKVWSFPELVFELEFSRNALYLTLWRRHGKWRNVLEITFRGRQTYVTITGKILFKSSAESQKGAIADQRCSVENQKGANPWLCTAIAPLWFSTEHLWAAIMPFWLSIDELCFIILGHYSLLIQTLAGGVLFYLVTFIITSQFPVSQSTHKQCLVKPIRIQYYRMNIFTSL